MLEDVQSELEGKGDIRRKEAREVQQNELADSKTPMELVHSEI